MKGEKDTKAAEERNLFTKRVADDAIKGDYPLTASYIQRRYSVSYAKATATLLFLQMAGSIDEGFSHEPRKIKKPYTF